MPDLADIPILAQAGNGLLATVILIVAVLGAVLTIAAYLILAERKVSAWIQDRIGPNRAGPRGLLQPLADVGKLLIKEDFTRGGADRWLYLLAPIWMVVAAFVAVGVVPLAGEIVVHGVRIQLQIAAPDVGVLFILAAGSLGVYGIVLGGWASNSKFSFLGALRSAAQLLSYEVPLGLTLLSVILIAGTLRLEDILAQQTGLWWGWLPRWNLFTQPVTFVVFLTCLLAETNRLPFDLPEAEQELVGGYHTEYSSMKFGLFFLSEYTNVLIGSALAAVLFLGGWGFWGLHAEQTQWYFGLARLAVLLGKIGLVIFLIMQVRWTLPRFRFDQLMRLAWKALVPASLLLLGVNGVLLWGNVQPAWFTVGNAGVFLAMAIGAAAAAAKGPVTGRQRMLRRDEELKIAN